MLYKMYKIKCTIINYDFSGEKLLIFEEFLDWKLHRINNGFICTNIIKYVIIILKIWKKD